MYVLGKISHIILVDKAPSSSKYKNSIFCLIIVKFEHILDAIASIKTVHCVWINKSIVKPCYFGG